MKNKIIFLAFISSYTFGQQDSILLQEVVVNDPFLKNHYNSQSQIQLTDSIIAKNNATLSNLLQFETPVYFKENGLGTVSSPSFRGTTASQTAVMWNGLNINSSINGQTDFSTINAKSYDGILIKPGGGSIAYGTGAIGGSIHLLDQLNYDNISQHNIDIGYGSFSSYQTNYRFHYAKDNLVTNIGYARFQSDNDYKIDNYLHKNRNGKYYFNTIDANVGFKIKAHELRFLSQFNFGKREFSLTDIYESPTMYENKDYRIMGQWIYNKSRWNSDFKLAYLHESNLYFPNRYVNNTQDLEVNNWIAKYYLKYKISDNQSISGFSENIYSKGNGTNISTSDRNTFGFGVIYNHKISNQLRYEASLRQDLSSVYNVPLIYAVGATYLPLDFYTIRFNFSKNYRVPTFNDLFWETGGNPDLKAENALQFELGNDFKFGEFHLQTNVFYNDIKDMIQWIPSSESSFWKPINQNHVKTYGAEVIGKYTWNQLNFRGVYSYTESINQITKNTLIYIPRHQFHINANYNLKKWNIYSQNRWVDKVYTQTDNNKSIPSYWTSNIGLGYKFNSILRTQLTVNNIFNHAYQSVENRYMPGINYQLSINIKL